MKKVISLTAGLTIILSALCGLIIGVARLQPQQDLGQYECGDQPCIANIFIGQTTWADAEAIVQKYPPFKKMSGNFEGVVGTFNAISYLSISSSTGNTVDSAEIIFHPPFQSIGSILAHYGNPCRVRVLAGKQQVDLNYPRFIASSSLMNPKSLGKPAFLTPSIPILVIDAATPGVDPCNPRQRVINRGFIVDGPWRGFLRIDR